MNRASFFGLGVVLLFACNNNKVFEEYYSIPNNSWHTDSALNFECMIVDTNTEYDVIIKVRHSTNYSYQNLFLFVHQNTTDTIELLLADKNGKWFGSGPSDVRELVYILEEKRKFSCNERYHINIEQAMRYGNKEVITNLNGVSAIGLSIKKHNE